MKIKHLKNYGKSLLSMMNTIDPEELKRINAASFSKIESALNLVEKDRFRLLWESEIEKKTKIANSVIDDELMNKKAFVSQQIEWAATFSSLTELKGKENAIAILKRSVETSYPEIFLKVFPHAEQLKQLDNCFLGFKEWFFAMMAANRVAGLFDYHIVEDDYSSFKVNINWCAWHQIFGALGVPDACIPVCHADDAFYPNYLCDLGMTFLRKKTLGWGADCCDFRFESND